MKKYILTVTLNPALDITMTLADLRREQHTVVSAGGKGVNVARSLKHFGVKVLTTGLSGGFTGEMMSDLLEEEKIQGDFVRIQGTTRVNLTITDLKQKDKMRILEDGPKVQKKELQRFKNKYQQLLNKSFCVVLSGRNIPGAADTLYAQLIRMANAKGIPTVLDTSGLPLLSGIKAKPSVVKPNLAEAEELLGRRLNTMPKIKEALHTIHKLGAGTAIISLDKRGAVGFDGEEVWMAKPPVVKVVNDVGCGDAFIAGLIRAYWPGESLQAALPMAVAAGTANVMSLKPGRIERKNLLKLSKSVRVVRL